MGNLPIQLNFLSISPDNFSFLIYRQEYASLSKPSSLYRAKLPTDRVSTEYKEYWVSLTEEVGFEKFLCEGRDNPYLTQWAIWQRFLQKATGSLSSSEHFQNSHNEFVKSIDFVLARHAEGHEVVEVQPYYLKAESKFGFLVNFAFRARQGSPYSISVQQLSLSLDKFGKSNVNYYSDQFDKINQFIQRFRARLFPFHVDLAEALDIDDNLLKLTSRSLRTKSYVFGAGKEAIHQFSGIARHGAFKTLEEEPLLVCIFRQPHRDAANEFYKYITGQKNRDHFTGMSELFGVDLHANNFKPIVLIDLSKESLDKVLVDIQAYRREFPSRAIIGVFLLDQKDDMPSSGFSPYHYLKYLFTSQCLPLQTIRIEKLMDPRVFQWSVANVALQIFSKLGGIPWKVKPSNEKCLIFGIGSAHKKDSDGHILKYFAYSVCLDSSGVYRKINVLGNSQNRTNYIEELRTNIQQSIEENVDNSIEKCVIHLPFKIRRDEMNYIEQGVRQVSGRYEHIQFQFIKINTHNKFFGFADNNTKIPTESTYVQLARDEFLVWFEGLQPGKNSVRTRVGNPVHIQFMNSAEVQQDQMMRYLQDIINLSGANWRGFNAKLVPVSIFYPNLIAKFIAEFYKFNPNGDIDLSNYALPWFL